MVEQKYIRMVPPRYVSFNFTANALDAFAGAAKMITRRFVLSGLVAAPAVIAADRLMKVHSLPQRYATVWGISHDLEIIEHPIWEPISVAAFGGSRAIEQFREVTEWEWGFPMEPVPPAFKNPRGAYAIDPLARFRIPDGVEANPFWPAGYQPPFYRLAQDMGPSAQTGIWAPERALKDDIASGGNNRDLRNAPLQEDANWQLWFDEAHKYEANLQAKYPVTGMPDGPKGWEVFLDKPRLGPETGWKITIKPAIET